MLLFPYNEILLDLWEKKKKKSQFFLLEEYSLANRKQYALSPQFMHISLGMLSRLGIPEPNRLQEILNISLHMIFSCRDHSLQ